MSCHTYTIEGLDFGRLAVAWHGTMAPVHSSHSNSLKVQFALIRIAEERSQLYKSSGNCSILSFGLCISWNSNVQVSVASVQFRIILSLWLRGFGCNPTSASKVSNILGALQLMFAVSIFQLLCVAEFPLEDTDQTFRRKTWSAARAWSCDTVNQILAASRLGMPAPCDILRPLVIFGGESLRDW